MFAESATVAPPEVAAWLKLTVHVELPPGLSVVGVHCNPLTVVVVVGDTVTDAVLELPFSVAVTVTV